MAAFEAALSQLPSECRLFAMIERDGSTALSASDDDLHWLNDRCAGSRYKFLGEKGFQRQWTPPASGKLDSEAIAVHLYMCFLTDNQAVSSLSARAEIRRCLCPDCGKHTIDKRVSRAGKAFCSPACRQRALTKLPRHAATEAVDALSERESQDPAFAAVASTAPHLLWSLWSHDPARPFAFVKAGQRCGIDAATFLRELSSRTPGALVAATVYGARRHEAEGTSTTSKLLAQLTNAELQARGRANAILDHYMLNPDQGRAVDEMIMKGSFDIGALNVVEASIPPENSAGTDCAGPNP